MNLSPCVNKRLLIVAAGTGGHVYPGLSVARHLRSQGWDVVWLGTSTGIEARLVPEANIPLLIISAKGLRGKGLANKLMGVLHLVVSFIQTLKLIRRIKPDVVLAMGGYVSGPGGVAAWLLRKPLVVHEQNSVPGLTNRLLKPFAKTTLQAFAHSFDSDQVQTVGNPVRPEFALSAINSTDVNDGEVRPLRLLVVGGSLGALSINQIMPACLRLIRDQVKDIDVWHQCGKAHLEATDTAYAQYGVKAQIDPFIDDMPSAFAWADVIVSRAGALTVSELMAAGKPSLLLPYPHAVDDHQTANARILVNAGAGEMLAHEQLTAEHLGTKLVSLLTDENLRRDMGRAALALSQPKAMELVAQHCIEASYG